VKSDDNAVLMLFMTIEANKQWLVQE